MYTLFNTYHKGVGGVSEKVDILIYSIGGCEGCPLSILRIYPKLVNAVNVYSKYLGETSLSRDYDIAIVSGSVCINDQWSMNTLKTIREHARILVAYGSCASVGGITLFCRGGQEPKPEHRTFQPLSTIVKVDYAIPGCPPAPNLLLSLINSIRVGRGFFLQLFASVVKARKLSGFDLLDEIVLSGLCIGCGACILSCPNSALQMIDGKPDLIVEKCIRCGTCCVRCPRFTQLLIRRYGVGSIVVR